jgi:manganese/zinc/iron transport system permease protein
MSDELWIIIIACLVGVSCSLVGVFLVLRKMSMLGDAISHSVLFGIVVAFLITGTRSPLAMFIGAVLTGILTTFITNFLNQRGKLQEDASIGVTFTWLFALGIILLSVYASEIDLDPDCALYGEIAFAPFRTITFLGRDIGPESFWMLLLTTLLNVCFIFFGYRALKTVSFDSQLAEVLGFNVKFWHYALMMFVSLTTVTAFDAVGAILVVAMLVIPPNTALLISKTVPQMIAWSLVFAILSSIGGYKLAEYFDASIGASIVCTSGILLMLIILIIKILLRVKEPLFGDK